jgi:hypothetical protein
VIVKRIISFIVGVSSAVAESYLIFLSVVVLYGYGAPEAPHAASGLLAVIVLSMAGIVLFESYRLLSFFCKKLN